MGRVSRRRSPGIIVTPVITTQNRQDMEGGTSCPFPIVQEDLLEMWGMGKGTKVVGLMFVAEMELYDTEKSYCVIVNENIIANMKLSISGLAS